MNNYTYHSNISYKTKILNQCRKIFIGGFQENFLIKKILASKEKSIWMKAIPPEYIYPRNSWRMYDRNGVKLKLDISNVVDHVKYFGLKDKGFDNFVNKLQPNYTVLDIGGNIGVTCLEIAGKVPGGRVIVFEPSLSNFQRLKENLRLNVFTNIVAVNRGIGDTPGQFTLYNVVDSNPGMKRILNQESAGNFESETIMIDTLGSQLNKLNISEINAIKIDVEGFEYKVLQSAALIMKTYKPVLFIELDDNNLKGQHSNARQLVNFLRELNYELYDARNTNQPLSRDFDFSNCHFDIICE